jgi:hypothetical protein
MSPELKSGIAFGIIMVLIGLAAIWIVRWQTYFLLQNDGAAWLAIYFWQTSLQVWPLISGSTSRSQCNRDHSLQPISRRFIWRIYSRLVSWYNSIHDGISATRTPCNSRYRASRTSQTKLSTPSDDDRPQYCPQQLRSLPCLSSERVDRPCPAACKQ